MKPNYSLGKIETDSFFIKRIFVNPKDIYEVDDLYEYSTHLFVVNQDQTFLKIHIGSKSKNHNIGHEFLAHNYNLENVLGGGCFSIDDYLNALVLDNYSGNYGAVPKLVLEKFGKLLLARFDCANFIVNPYLPKLKAHWKDLNIE